MNHKIDFGLHSQPLVAMEINLPPEFPHDVVRSLAQGLASNPDVSRVTVNFAPPPGVRTGEVVK